MNQYYVRFLQQDDAENWLKMWQEYMEFYQTTLPFEVVTHTLNTLLSADKNILCLIACDPQHTPVAFLNFVIHLSTWSIAPECYLEDLYVKPVHRKAGIAKMLLEELKQMSKKQHWSRVYWITKPDNLIAQTFYNKIAKSEPWLRYVMS